MMIWHCLFGFFLFVHMSFANVQQNIERVLKDSRVSKKDLGIVVLDELGKSLYLNNEAKKFTPASLTKILVAYAGLKTFDGSHRFKTQLYFRGEKRESIWKGSLYLVGLGDPTFTSERMWNLVNDFKRSGVERIQGDIIVDDTYFDNRRIDSGRDTRRVSRAYDAPIGAVSFNWNTVNVYVNGVVKDNFQPRVSIDPPNDYIVIENRLRNGRKSVQIQRKTAKGKEVIRVSGSYPLSEGESVFYVNVKDPVAWTGNNLKSFLKRRGIIVEGRVRSGKLLRDVSLVAEVEGRSLPEIIFDMMKFSNNFIAEMLTKNIGVKERNRPGTMKKGLNVIEDLLKRGGFSKGDFKIVSPSGLSRKNKMKPLALAKLLFGVRKDLRMYPEFAHSLPLAGLDGTLEKRFQNTSRHWLRGKTGLLGGAVGLAGYVGNKEGGVKTYVFLYNGRASVERVWRLFDNLGEVLAQ